LLKPSVNNRIAQIVLQSAYLYSVWQTTRLYATC
jgi:hypothetical protein